jgi:tetratricopeptide (TPR) repeat protein
VANDASVVVWRNYLFKVHLSLGRALIAQHKLKEGLSAFRDAEALAAKIGDNDKWRLDLAQSYLNAGDLLGGQGKPDEALAAYRDANQIAKTLVAKDKTNAEWQQSLGFSYVGIGNVLSVQGKLAEALASYRDSIAIVTALIGQHGGNPDWQIDLRYSAEKLGGLAYSFVRARNFATALEVADQAIALAPDLIFVHANRAHALLFLGRVEEARALYLQYRGRKNVVDEKSWEAHVLEDFAGLRQSGLAHPLMHQIEKQFAAGG